MTIPKACCLFLSAFIQPEFIRCGRQVGRGGGRRGSRRLKGKAYFYLLSKAHQSSFFIPADLTFTFIEFTPVN